MNVSFESVRRGQHLVDQYGQVCRVVDVSRKYRQVVTRRKEDRSYWDCTASWTPEQFNARPWRRVKG